jgi:hypothetical protein
MPQSAYLSHHALIEAGGYMKMLLHQFLDLIPATTLVLRMPEIREHTDFINTREKCKTYLMMNGKVSFPLPPYSFSPMRQNGTCMSFCHARHIAWYFL